MCVSGRIYGKQHPTHGTRAAHSAQHTAQPGRPPHGRVTSMSSSLLRTFGSCKSPIVTPVSRLGMTNRICSNPHSASIRPRPTGIASFTLLGISLKSRHERPNAAMAVIKQPPMRQVVPDRVKLKFSVIYGVRSQLGVTFHFSVYIFRATH
jgi:hypothetical protein